MHDLFLDPASRMHLEQAFDNSNSRDALEGAPNQNILFHASFALYYGSALEVELRLLYTVVSHPGYQRIFWDFYKTYWERSPDFYRGDLRGACELLAKIATTGRQQQQGLLRVRPEQMAGWRTANHLALYMANCWYFLQQKSGELGLRWRGADRAQVIVGLLGVYLHLAEVGVFGPKFDAWLSDPRAHVHYREAMVAAVTRTELDLTCLFEELEKDDYIRGIITHKIEIFSILNEGDVWKGLTVNDRP